MFKTISAALLAVSVLAAPAFAATAGKSAQAPVIKATPAKASVLNAKASMGKHHHKYVRHHRHHNKFVAKRAHHPKVTFKHASPAPAKRG
jgi:hypothetical protein